MFQLKKSGACTDVIRLRSRPAPGLTGAAPDLLERNMRHTDNRSLRYQVEKWLAPAPTSSVHVTEFGRTRWGRTRYVRVETSSPTGLRVLFFFRHGDGTWHVFPPAADRQRSTAERIGG
jgi:hypothetical protein